jgi:hypothetical protein
MIREERPEIRNIELVKGVANHPSEEELANSALCGDESARTHTGGNF